MPNCGVPLISVCGLLPKFGVNYYEINFIIFGPGFINTYSKMYSKYIILLCQTNFSEILGLCLLFRAQGLGPKGCGFKADLNTIRRTILSIAWTL